MIKKRYFLLALLSWFFFLEMLSTSCARPGSPGGGPRDTVAPVLDTTFPPNESVFFESKEIILVFDEYLKAGNVRSQITISPPLKDGLNPQIDGRELVLRITDTLRDSTTYIISFGEAVADLNESNINRKVKYVFSTGSYLDSLQLQGRVLDAQSGEPSGKMLAAMYELSQTKRRDSFLYRELPSYYAYTGEDGSFAMTNMRGGDYLLLAFEDGTSDFKLNSGKEKMAFVSDTIRLRPDSNYRYTLYSYKPLPEQKFNNASHRDKGLISFAFKRPVDSMRVKPLSDSLLQTYFALSKNRDTGFFWYQSAAQLDSLVFAIEKPLAYQDTVTVMLFAQQRDKIALTAPLPKIKAGQAVALQSNYPIVQHADSVWAYTDKDTLKVALRSDSADKRKLWAQTQSINRDVKLILARNTIETYYGLGNDSSAVDVQFFKKDELGTVLLVVKVPDSSYYRLQIVQEQTLIREEALTDSLKITFKDEFPGSYSALLIGDNDSNGRWTPGNFWEDRQPERLFRFGESIEIRENWEVELEWRFTPPE